MAGFQVAGAIALGSLATVRTDPRVSAPGALGLLVLYGGFIAWMAAESLGHLALLG
jgi:hypothetical protein